MRKLNERKSVIAIIDFRAGNAGSVKKAFDFLKMNSKITGNTKEILNAERIVFPGVGSFGETMKELKKRKLDSAIKTAIGMQKPFLGICIGMQALFEESEESKGVKGMGILKGKVKKYRKGKIPQIGWNEVIPAKKGIMKGYAYFVNSYYCVPKENIVLAETDYNGFFASAVKKENITGVQFHPEKSGKYGLEFLRKWLEC
ncbi:MAG: imidazole glycerol phosphate synthase subunit HisH [Candidatus Diapherotrites archaeon]